MYSKLKWCHGPWEFNSCSVAFEIKSWVFLEERRSIWRGCSSNMSRPKAIGNQLYKARPSRNKHASSSLLGGARPWSSKGNLKQWSGDGLIHTATWTAARKGQQQTTSWSSAAPRSNKERPKLQQSKAWSSTWRSPTNAGEGIDLQLKRAAATQGEILLFL